MSDIWKRKGKEQGMDYIETDPVPYLSFPILEKNRTGYPGIFHKNGWCQPG